MPNEHENPDHGQTDELRDKAFRLFTYLKEVCQLRFVVVRDCRNYDQLLWFHDIPREPECLCIAWSGPTETNESWIEVRRSSEPACPPVPNVCKDWISPSDLVNSGQTPTLRERNSVPPSFHGLKIDRTICVWWNCWFPILPKALQLRKDDTRRLNRLLQFLSDPEACPEDKAKLWGDPFVHITATAKNALR